MARGALWTADHIEILRARYPTDDLDALADELGRPRRSLISKAFDLKIVRKPVTTYRRRHFENAHPNTWPGPWKRRCACGAIFTAMSLDDTDCGACP